MSGRRCRLVGRWDEILAGERRVVLSRVMTGLCGFVDYGLVVRSVGCVKVDRTEDMYRIVYVDESSSEI